jgi:tRNA (cytidine/uridine-2'-O-)-methyltransferase
MVFLSSNVKKLYWYINYTEHMFLIFGKESKGLSPDIIKNNLNRTYKIPLQSDKVRSINLANAVSIVVYEGLRTLL